MMNTPYNGGTHLPDVKVITRVFDEHATEVLFAVASHGRHADVWAHAKFRPPHSRHIEGEGRADRRFLPPSRRPLPQRGEARTALHRSVPLPQSRPEQRRPRRSSGGERYGFRELHMMVAKFGRAVVNAYKHVQDFAE